jgi:hypothetical protein
LTVVRLDQTGTDADGAITAAGLIDRLRERLIEDPAAANEFATGSQPPDGTIIRATRISPF